MSTSNNLIERRKDVLGGTPVFKGTRVPVSTFFEYLEAGHSLNVFLKDFPTATNQQSIPTASIQVVLLKARINTYDILLPLVEKLTSVMKAHEPGKFLEID